MTNKDTQIKALTTTALMTAVLCVLGPMSLPIGPVPISLTNLALYFMVYIVGTRTSFFAYLLYMLLGLVGMPVFSGYAGGPQKLFGPTGGYIIGFLPMILITLSDISYGLMYYIIAFLLRGRLGIAHYLTGVILPEVLYTLLVSLVVYPLLLGTDTLFKRYRIRKEREKQDV